jgi:hypothetical protein
LNAAKTMPHPKPVSVDKKMSFIIYPLLDYSVDHKDLQFCFRYSPRFVY